MTREELKEHCIRQIQQFERVEKIMAVTPNDWKRYEEHKLILELLEQEPCDDCISRQAVLDVWRTSYSDNREENEEIQYKKIAFELPPVTPQPKTGHWIHFASSDDCSECGWSTGKYISPSKYCPNCGAIMVEPQESEGE